VTAAKAYPRKHFFLEMFTRDISFEDCVLDLIDNSMDSLLKTNQVDIEQEVLKVGTGTRSSGRIPAHIRVEYSEDQFLIADNCGGIRYDEAINEVFCFGHHADGPKGRLGVYGIGLKRALFKIGNEIRVESHTTQDGFRVSINLDDWSKKDDKLEDWTFPITKLNGGVVKSKAGTSITITELHREVKTRLNDGTVDAILCRNAAQTYPFFLNELVDLKINATEVETRALPFGGSSEVDPGISRFEAEGVKVTLMATLAPKGKRSQELAGWYVLCNGRVVVAADKSDLTGWGSGLPAFHSKYIGFIGLALLTSDDPECLPWTTSKRGLNREAVIYQRTRNKMASVAKPVITFLNDMYPSDLPERPAERDIAERVVQTDFRQLLQSNQRQFAATTSVPKRRTSRIQFDAAISDIDKVRKKLRRPGMSASEVGRYTFAHFLKTECAD
jgi:hypothetical protein